jgi:hypothetical protein
MIKYKKIERGNTMEATQLLNLRKLKRSLIGVLVLVCLFAAAIAAAWFSGHSHARRQAETDKELTIRVDEVEDTVPTPTDPEINLQILYSEINDIGELATVEYLFTDAAKYSESMQYDGWDIPFTEKSFVLKWNGVIKAGVDLKRIRITVDEENKNITVSMPAAKILSYEVDNDSIEVLDERDNIFNSISVDDKTRFDATTEDAMKQRAIKNGLLNKAQENAEVIIKRLLTTDPAIGSRFHINFIIEE